MWHLPFISETGKHEDDVCGTCKAKYSPPKSRKSLYLQYIVADFTEQLKMPEDS